MPTWPNATTTSDNLNAGAAIVEPLYWPDPRSGKPQPLLVESHRLLEPTLLQLKLRGGVKFSNGEAMNADAVVHSIKLFIDPKIAPAYAIYAKTISGAEKVDDLTVNVRMAFPYPAIELLLTQIYVTPPGYWNQVGPAELGQDLADRALVEPHVETLADHPLQIDPAPAHNAIARQVGAGEHDRLQLRLLGRRQQRPSARRFTIDKPIDTLGVVAMHPIPKRLAIHAAGRRRLGARRPLQDQCDRQDPTHLRRIAKPLRCLPKFRRTQLQTLHRNAHDPSLANPKEANHAS